MELTRTVSGLPAYIIIIAYVWLVASLVIGAMGMKRKIGFSGAFVSSFFLSPLVGILVVLESNLKIRCRHCGYISNTIQDFCPVCGKNEDGETLEQLKERYCSDSVQVNEEFPVS